MGLESDLLEIVILGAIAVFLVFRLVSTLGHHSGFQQPLHKKNLGDVVTPPAGAPASGRQKEEAVLSQETVASLPEHLQEGAALLKKYDPSFSVKAFLEGATTAYEMVLQAFSKEDLETLKSLMDKSLLADFQEAIEGRQAKNLTLETTLIRMCDVRADSIQKGAGNKVLITVTFVTEQNHLLKNQEGDLVEGSPRQTEEVTDTWTFAKSLRSKNPNWTLVATGE